MHRLLLLPVFLVTACSFPGQRENREAAAIIEILRLKAGPPMTAGEALRRYFLKEP